MLVHEEQQEQFLIGEGAGAERMKLQVVLNVAWSSGDFVFEYWHCEKKQGGFI